MVIVQGIGGIAKKMLTDINGKFDPVINHEAANFDPPYVASTLLNPSYHLPLNANQVNAAKSFILSLIANGKFGCQNSTVSLQPVTQCLRK